MMRFNEDHFWIAWSYVGVIALSIIMYKEVYLMQIYSDYILSKIMLSFFAIFIYINSKVEREGLKNG